MIDDRLFGSLRRFAALVHAVPDSVLVVEVDGEALLRVGNQCPGRIESEQSASACGFRNAVARAWSLHRDGHRMGFLSLTGAEELELRFVTGLTAEPEPDGVIRIRIDAEQVALFATTLDIDMVRDLADPTHPVGLREDRALGVTLAHVHDAGDPMARLGIGDLAARCVVEELVESVNPLVADRP